MQIAIDGPAGAGKSSVAKEIAHRLGLKYLDTGAMYRSITFLALREGIDPNNGALLAEAAHKCKLEISYDNQMGNCIFLDGKDITAEIRSPEINKFVSVVSKCPELRDELVFLQKKIAENSDGIVMEGRDIGTNVLKNADYKFFLFASLEERSQRRWKEMKEKGTEISLDEVIAEIATRDRIDQEREASPLTVAPEAEIIDTTSYSLDEVVEKILSFVEGNENKKRGLRMKEKFYDEIR